MEPRFNEPLHNEESSYLLLELAGMSHPGQSYSKLYGKEPRYNEAQYNEILVITKIIQKPKRIIYPDMTNKCQHATKD